MANNNRNITRIPLASDAENLARDYAVTYAQSLLYHARTLAYSRKEEVVLTTHINQAQEILSNPQKRNWQKELVVVIGSTLLGVSIALFIGEVIGLTRTPPTASFLVLLFSFLFTVGLTIATVIAITKP